MTASIQFRFLQVVVNHAADERVTVALVHWDGRELRVAVNPTRIPDSIPSKADLGPLLRSLRLSLIARLPQLALPMGFDDLLPLGGGETGLLSWSAVHQGTTADPRGHFEYLARSLNLQRDVLQKARGSAEPAFAQFAEGLEHEFALPERVRAHFPLKGLADHDSPLSWKNGVWRHTFPLDAPSTDWKGVVRRLERTFGRIDACVPRGDIGVIVALYEPSERLDEILLRTQEHIERNLLGRVQSTLVPVTDGKPDFGALRDQVHKDVGH